MAVFHNNYEPTFFKSIDLCGLTIDSFFMREITANHFENCDTLSQTLSLQG